jgi:glycine cleavage system regulatory protein
LQIELRPASEAKGASAQAIPYRLTATAIDQPGLVHRLSHLLRAAEVNIESLETHLKPAPITGTPMFEMEIDYFHSKEIDADCESERANLGDVWGAEHRF